MMRLLHMMNYVKSDLQQRHMVTVWVMTDGVGNAKKSDKLQHHVQLERLQNVEMLVEQFCRSSLQMIRHVIHDMSL